MLCQALFYIFIILLTPHKIMFYYTFTMLKLNTEKIERERKRLGLTKTELAKRMGISKQLLHYTIKKQQIFHIEEFAFILEFEPKDLII